MKNPITKDSSKIAGKIYDVSDYSQNDQLSSGLAKTHEQVSDAYMEGEIKPVIENVNGKDTGIPQKGYNQ